MLAKRERTSQDDHSIDNKSTKRKQDWCQLFFHKHILLMDECTSHQLRFVSCCVNERKKEILQKKQAVKTSRFAISSSHPHGIGFSRDRERKKTKQLSSVPDFMEAIGEYSS